VLWDAFRMFGRTRSSKLLRRLEQVVEDESANNEIDPIESFNLQFGHLDPATQIKSNRAS
jgi:hypothetical protein